MTDINIIEGSINTVTVPITGFVPLSNYSASIQFRDNASDKLMFQFQTVDNTLNIADQTLVFNILPSLSVGKVGKGKWQIALWTNENDIFKIDPFNYEITKAVNKP